MKTNFLNTAVSGVIILLALFSQTTQGADSYLWSTLGAAAKYGSADGVNTSARFNLPAAAAVVGAGNVYVADTWNNTIRRIAPVGTNWVATTIAGRAGVSGSTDGPGSAARFYSPNAIVVDASTNLFVSDLLNMAIREITPNGTNWVVTTLTTSLISPNGLALDSSGKLYVAGSRTVWQLTKASAGHCISSCKQGVCNF